MRFTPTALTAAAVIMLGGVTGCAGLLDSAANAADLQVGDCLTVGGPVDRPAAARAECGSVESNFKVAATVTDGAKCPTDIDSSYSERGSFSGSSNTVCLDIDWVVGGCMSVGPENDADPVRVDCNDTTRYHRQRATQRLSGVANVDQCASGQGYAYDEREFTVCVENIA